jgi:predicted O-linked N-acetylglucosamine transferase (SPINDLY family)
MWRLAVPYNFAMPSKSKHFLQPKVASGSHLVPRLARFEDALALHNQGRWAQAQAICEEIVRLQPEHAKSLHLLGVLAGQRGNHQQAIEWFGKAIKRNPGIAAFYANRGIAHSELRQFDAALTDFDKAIRLKPDFAEAHYNRANVLKELRQIDAAVASYDKAIELRPDYHQACCNRGNALAQLGQFDIAVASYDQAISAKPDYAVAYSNRGNALQELKQHEAAIASFDKAIQLKPDYAEAYYNRGNVQKELRQFEAAIASYDQAVSINPGSAACYSNRGNALLELKQIEAALASFDKAIELKPDYAEAHYNRANALKECKQLNAAVSGYDRAIALKPDYAEAYSNRGSTLKELMQFDAAVVNFDKAIALRSNLDLLLVPYLNVKSHLCDWRQIRSQLDQLDQKILGSHKASPPFPVLALTDSALTHRRCAEFLVTEKYMPVNRLPPIAGYSRHKKIRIGYFSADFHAHATMHLMAEMFEAHDRQRFELFAFSFGPDRQDPWRQRALSAFDRFFEIRMKTDRQVAALSRELEIDIAVDLKGFTADNRTGIFAQRAAPVQVNYLGYPGTMAAPYIDYLIADATLIREDSQKFYSEKIAYLPHSYQANCRTRTVSEKMIRRSDFGLPEAGFVFCSFNDNYKINPDVFDSWMRILKQVEGSVLWVLVSNETAKMNLRAEAQGHGIDSTRLVFAAKLPVEEHLNRLRLADLFLDTFPYNAHTTASDALRMGLPVLTRTGQTFASRVGASLLGAVGLPELVTSTPEEYEALAVQLARNPNQLALIKQKLLQNLPNCPLYDSQLFTRHLEAVYEAMYSRCANNLAPDHIRLKIK